MPTYTPNRTLMRVIHLIERANPIKPNNANIIDKMDMVCNQLLSELGITRDHETFNRYVQTVQDGQSEYAIMASGFTSPFLAETWDDGADPYFVPEQLTITPVQNRERLVFSWPGVPELQGSNTGTVLSFFTEDGQPKILVSPPPRGYGRIRLYFMNGSVQLGLDGQPLPLADWFNPLLATETALLCLGSTGHDDTTFKRIEKGLERFQASTRSLFEMQRFQQTASSEDRAYFGWERDAEGYY